MTLNQTECLRQGLLDNDHDISSALQEQILHYLHLLRQWNKVFNLTSIRDPKDMIYLHILDSLAISQYLVGTRIIDVGTGAGLPGLPLALIHPDKFFVLLDSTSKKTRFLTQVIHELKIPNAEVINQRAEEFQPTTGFDSILSRAFASLTGLLETTEHLVAEHGQFLAMKGVYPAKEIMEIPTTFKVLATHKLIINGLNAERHLVCLVKEH